MSATRSGTETIPNSFLFPIPNIPNIPSIPVGSESQCPTGLGAPSDAVGAEEVSWPGGQHCVCAQGVSKVPASGGCAALFGDARVKISHTFCFFKSPLILSVFGIQPDPHVHPCLSETTCGENAHRWMSLDHITSGALFKPLHGGKQMMMMMMIKNPVLGCNG